MEQRSKYQNEFTKKKWIGDYPKEPNRQQVVSGGTTPSSTGTPSATQDPLIDTECDDDVSSSVPAKKMALVDDTINNSLMHMEDMVPPTSTWQTKEKRFELACQKIDLD